MINKYQFYIAYHDKFNTAGSKAVLDCKSILAEMGYQDFSIEDVSLGNRLINWIKILRRVALFFLKLKPNAIVAIQYPLLSGNRHFGLFIRAAKSRNIKFFCIVHDLDDLRHNNASTRKNYDVNILNGYDYVIVHNHGMRAWLLENKLTTPVIVLGIFDYLSIISPANKPQLAPLGNRIIFAGNLSKSRFIYALDVIEGYVFNLYGPNYRPEKGFPVKNICWHGSLSPEELLTNMSGEFGLVWDGEYIDKLDENYGSYLKFNSPHKLSLYLAAGIPVIAPANSAVAEFIKQHNIGILINDLLELNHLKLENDAYHIMQQNVFAIKEKINAGNYLTAAVKTIEENLFPFELSA